MPYLGTFKPEFEKPLSYLKSALSNLSKCQVLCLRKKVKFRTKIVLFGYFWIGI